MSRGISLICVPTAQYIIRSLAIDAAKKFITKEYGEKYSQVRQYQTKSRNAQEAHEAIRPTQDGPAWFNRRRQRPEETL